MPIRSKFSLLATGQASGVNNSEAMERMRIVGASSARVGFSANQPYRQRLNNFRDVRYTADLEIGGQSLQALIDTGSFEVLVLSDACKTCGKAKSYRKNASSTYKNSTGRLVTQKFDSGSVKSVEGFETVQVGPYSAIDQAFWEVIEAQMPILQSSSRFSAILGLGPPKSANMLVTKNAEVEAGQRPSRRTLVQNLGVSTYSMCLGRKPGSPGYFVWNDINPAIMPSVFTRIPVVGAMHWGVDLRNVRLGHQPWEMTSVESRLGCQNGCGAIVDSGASLITVPEVVVQQVKAAIRVNNCSSVEALPDLVFNFGGHEVSLPPDSYIGQGCEPLLLPMDVRTSSGPLWILGLPFFRKYYVSFVATSKNGGAPDHGEGNRHLYISEASTDCRPSRNLSLIQLRSDNRPWKFIERPRLRRLHPSDIHSPSWLDAAKRSGVYEL
eukprot:gnl/TRDRNA2_/TRDRNA2_173990_c3_seq20.p1 gnl/TRDRNA2_/TRDRNA2_173990_c3~~gnl/TRDRNA2_/TRDRNA2_173990_c3_seq20.p1  ORF type:complete len:439 (-),score=53.76 gnl/TRDRNA2_/TRDRNA2_173990_c3_seq20:72-1388(-)